MMPWYQTLLIYVGVPLLLLFFVAFTYACLHQDEWGQR